MIFLLFALQFFSPTLAKDRTPNVLMEGIWVSCPDDDGEYEERAIVHTYKGVALLELHLGPATEFAIFPGEIDGHVAHNDPRNVLGPAYHYDDLKTVSGGRNWSSAVLGIKFNVIAMPPTRLDCYAFSVLLTHTPAILAKQ